MENKKRNLLFFNLCILFAPRDTSDPSTKDTRKQIVIYLRQATEYSKENYLKTTHHNVFLNTEKRDLHPYASPEGARRTPLKGGEWRLQNGALGAAIWLKALSQTPPEITRHPKTPLQLKNKHNP